MSSQELVKQYFEYKDGSLYWKTSAGNKKKGDRFGCLSMSGYIEGGFQGRGAKEHRLVFLYHYGYLPEEIDHINRNRADNRIENLREVSRSDNMKNKPVYKNNKLGHKGIRFRNGNYQARIRLNRKLITIGTYKTLDEADTAYHNKAVELFGDFYVKGRA